MQRSKSRGKWVGVAIATLACIAHAQDGPTKVSKPLRDLEQERSDLVVAHRDEFTERGRRVLDECNEPGAPEWAGRYCASDTWSLTVAPRSGAVYSCSTCTALLDLNYGPIREIRPDRLVVDFQFDIAINRPWARLGRELPALSGELYFVNWGERRYLIPAAQMIAFCNEWNSGTLGTAYFPLLRPAGSWPDREKPPSVVPSVPSEFGSYLLDAPITGRVRWIHEATDYFDSKSEPWRKIRATVDVGADAKLLRGMGLWIQGRPNSWMGEVVETRGMESTVVFRCPNGGTGGSPLTFPEVGDSVSTRKQELVRGR